MTKAKPVECAIDCVANEASARWSSGMRLPTRPERGPLVADQGQEAEEGEQDGEADLIERELGQLGMQISQMVAAERAVQHPDGDAEHRRTDDIGQDPLRRGRHVLSSGSRASSRNTPIPPEASPRLPSASRSTPPALPVCHPPESPLAASPNRCARTSATAPQIGCSERRARAAAGTRSPPACSGGRGWRCGAGSGRSGRSRRGGARA